MTASQIVCSNLNQHMTYADVAILAKEHNFEWDGYLESYEMQYNAVVDVGANNVPGIICEIGVRLGYGIFTMM